MNCEQAKELFADDLREGLEENQRAELDFHLSTCALCQTETKNLRAVWIQLSSLPKEHPSPCSEARFRSMVSAYRAGMEQAGHEPVIRGTLTDWLAHFWPAQPALQSAVVLLLFVSGMLMGTMFHGYRQANGSADTAKDLALAQLREEVSGMKQLVMLSLLQQQSASERLRGVEWSYRVEQPDEEAFVALLRALDSDSNVNVRLAAVDALQRFASHALVKKGLLDSLPRQPSPLVQIEMINLVVELKEKDSIPVLRSLLQQNQLDPMVRERAEWGLQQLG